MLLTSAIHKKNLHINDFVAIYIKEIYECCDVVFMKVQMTSRIVKFCYIRTCSISRSRLFFVHLACMPVMRFNLYELSR